MAASLLVAGCGGEPLTTVPWPLLLDPQVAMLDELAPHTTFDGVSGSLVLGEGWPPLIDYGDEAHAWATGGKAIAYFLGPPGQELDFVARCGALDVPGVSPQELAIFVNGDRVGTTPIRPGWQEVRVPLPADLRMTGLNELRLEFAWALRPQDVIPGNDDPRPLSAHFSHLGIVPRAMSDPWSFLAAAELRPEERTARLPVGGSLTIPVPPAVDLEFAGPRIAWRCRDCRLAIESVGESDGVRPLATATPGEERVPRVRVRSGEGLERLRFRVESAEPFDAIGHVVLTFPEGSLRIRRRPMAKPPRPNLLVYLVDTLRADALEPYGAAPGSSPSVTAFARDAVVYRHPWSPSSWTLPATYSVLTGLAANRHGMMAGGLFAPHDDVVPVPTRLARLGYETFGISHSYIVGPEYSFDRGFTRFVASNQLGVPRVNGFLVRRAVVQWLLSRLTATPFFLYVHTVDPHPPYTPPAELLDPEANGAGELSPAAWDPLQFMRDGQTQDEALIRRLERRYRAEVRYADREFGALLDLLRYLRLYEPSLVALLSDHGEEFTEHGGLGHGRTVYEEMLQVPLIVKYPHGQFAGHRVEEAVSTLDLVPTLLRLALAAPTEPVELDGRVLPPVEEQGRRLLTAEVTLGANPWLSAIDYRALRLGTLKCVHSRGSDQFGEPVPEHRAFDLSADPAELAPHLLPEPPAMRCRRLVTGWLRSREERESDAREPSSEEARQMLRALGYIR